MKIRTKKGFFYIAILDSENSNAKCHFELRHGYTISFGDFSFGIYKNGDHWGTCELLSGASVGSENLRQESIFRCYLASKRDDFKSCIDKMIDRNGYTPKVFKNDNS
jgi:hypothetical protein